MAMAPFSTRQRRGAESYRRGLWAEALCRFVLRLKFYKIVARRFKGGMGEIDLIAARGHTLAFIEVKARPDRLAAGEAVSVMQQRRLANAAAYFLSRNPHFAQFHIRFDVMWVLPKRWPVHIENAFAPQQRF